MSKLLLRNLGVVGMSGGILLMGWALMKYTPPSREEFVRRLPPDQRASYEARIKAAKKQNEQVLKAMIDNVDSGRPSWDVRNMPKSDGDGR